MLPLYDAELNTQTYNIFQPIPSILPYDLPKLSANSIDLQPSATTAVSSASPFKKSPEIDTYCKACKKKFSNAITYTNHLKSAKHIANEKKVSNTTTKSSSKHIAVNPQVQDALAKLEQAASLDTTQAVGVYWSQAQILFALKRPQYTEKALSLLISTLSSNASTTTYSSAQITAFLYNSRLALARLYCIYQHLTDARSIYLDALESKWKLDKKELVEIAKNIRHLSISNLLSNCEQLACKYLTRERNRTKPAPALTDPNNSITTVLREAGNLFVEECQDIAIVLYATCSLVCPFEQVQADKSDFYYLIKQVYASLVDLEHRIIELDMLDLNDTWNVFNALLLALEIDDLVRAQTIQSVLENQVYPDVQLLRDICRSRLTLDHTKHNVDYIQLLLASNEPLLISNRSKQEQANIMDRIRDLIQ